MARPWLALGALLLACTSSSPKGGAPSVAKPAHAQAIVKQLQGFSAFADHLGHGQRLELRDGGYALANSGKTFRLGAMSATLPTRADGALRLSDDSRSRFTLDLVAEDLAKVPGEAHEGAVVFADAAPDTDVVQIAEPDRFEEVRILRSPKAKAEARWRVSKGPGIAALRVREGIVEALDLEGRARLRTEPAFAVDSKGVRRAVKLALEGDVLVARFDDKDLVYPVALDPTWIISLFPLPNTNFRDVAWILLSDGRVTAFTAGVPGPAAVFDPNTEKWTSTGTNVTAAYRLGVATTLGSGKILLAAGESHTNAELWGLPTGPTATGALSVQRSAMGWVQINKGTVGEKVILYGGALSDGSGTAYSTVEQYDPGSGTWSLRGPLPNTKMSHSATNLGDGTVLLAGGRESSWSTQALLHDLTTDLYTALPNMPSARAQHESIALSTGNVLVLGGTNNPYATVNTTALYNRATKTWTSGPNMKYTRQDPRIVTYGAGKWLIMGGFGRLGGTGSGDTYLSTTEIYDEASNTMSDGPSMLYPRTRFGAVWLNDGRLLVGGGIGGASSDDKVEFLTPDKKTCTSGTECTSGFCSEGYCCNRACTGQCEACNVGGREGICETISGEAPHVGKPSCGAYVQCVAGACATTCTSDTGCASGTAYCTSGNACAPKKANGAGCTAGNECSSGNCVDGVCCNTTCAGQCFSCGESTSLGTCTAIDGAPRGTRPACTSPWACSAGSCASGCTKDAECASNSYCETSTNTCKPKLGAGAACTASTNCTTNFCVDGYCCNSACTGTCQACNVPTKLGTCSNVASGTAPNTGKSCAPYATCNGAGACSSLCTLDTQCTGTAYCLGSACVTRKSNGNACASNLECTSGFCAAGVCCNSACTGECESCGTGTCTPKASSVLCGLSGCVGNWQVPKGKCNGTTNVCDPQPATACPGSLKCASATACLTTCSGDGDCVSGTCSGGTCVVSFDAGPDTFVPDTGAPDTFVPDTFVPDTTVADTTVADTTVADTTVEDTSPADTSIVDGYGVAETPAPKLDDKPEVKAEFKRCNKASDCESGFCVEGVCCDSSCGDRCHTCALLTSPGKCTLEPIGVDLKSECGPALSCLGTCGDKGECVGSGTGTMCARNRCSGPNTGVGPAYCSGPGAKCPTNDVTPFDCSPYICEPAFGACRTACVSSNDCAQGFTCDTGSKSCVPAPTPEPDDSSCAVSNPGVQRGGLGMVAVLVGLSLLARRRVRPSR